MRNTEATMSFDGDLLHKIGATLKDSGGVSSDYQDASSFLRTLSQTLQHLNTLQNADITPEVVENV
jgi:hypothetical protein